MTTWRNYYGIKKIAVLGVTMTLINGFIDIINVVHEKSWRSEGRSLAELRIEGMTKDTLLKYVRTGEK